MDVLISRFYIHWKSCVTHFTDHRSDKAQLSQEWNESLGVSGMYIYIYICIYPIICTCMHTIFIYIHTHFINWWIHDDLSIVFWTMYIYMSSKNTLNVCRYVKSTNIPIHTGKFSNTFTVPEKYAACNMYHYH